MNDSIWASIETRKRKKQRYLFSLSGVAASITLLLAFFIYNNVNSRGGYAEKEALLNEALSMFSEEEPTLQRKTILYEDELVIIYVAAK